MTNFAIGCLVQWYEADMINEYFSTLRKSIDSYDGNVLVDILVSTNEALEKCESIESKTKCINTIKDYADVYKFQLRFTDNLFTIADYRRFFNDDFCEKVDVLVWGESDMLVPKQMFTVLDLLHKNSVSTKYLAFFSTCKMWDESWKLLEHPKFTEQPFVSGPDHKDKWWSHWYTMSEQEMNDINSTVEYPEVIVLPEHKFNGCGLIISSEVIKSGVNIPRSVFFVHEDTSMMFMTRKILGNIPQYVIKNILLVHNRKHPKKRLYIKNEDDKNLELADRRERNDWYQIAEQMSRSNCYNIFNNEYKSFTWTDVNDQLK